MAKARVQYGGGLCTVWPSGRLECVWRRFVSVWRRLMAAGDSLYSLWSNKLTLPVTLQKKNL